MINELSIKYNKTYNGTVKGREKFLAFFSNGSSYAIKSSYVSEIIGETKVTFVPMLPAHISGIINLRGVLVPIIDLSLMLNNTKSEKYLTLILKKGSEQVGLLVEEIDQMIDIDTTTISLKEDAHNLPQVVAGTALSPHMEENISILNIDIFFKDTH